MASLVYNTAKKEIFDGTIDLTAADIKVMLIGTATPYTPDADHDTVDQASGSELSATNYTGGFAGAGRKAFASPAIAVDKTNDRAEFDATDLTWTSLGGAANDTVEAAIIIREVTNDAGSRLIAYIDLTNTTTDGSNFTIQWDAEGILQLS